MPRYINTNPNPPAETNGVKFQSVNGKMITIESVDGENAEIFRNVPGFIELPDTKVEDKPVAPVELLIPAEAAPAPQEAPEAPAEQPSSDAPADPDAAGEAKTEAPAEAVTEAPAEAPTEAPAAPAEAPPAASATKPTVKAKK